MWKTFARAVFLAQHIVGCPDVEEQHALVASDVSYRQQLLGRQVDDYVLVALGDEIVERGNGIRVGLDLGDIQVELLLEEGARGVVVADAQFGPGNTLVRRRDIKYRQRQLRRIGTQIADPDFG